MPRWIPYFTLFYLTYKPKRSKTTLQISKVFHFYFNFLFATNARSFSQKTQNKTPPSKKKKPQNDGQIHQSPIYIFMISNALRLFHIHIILEKSLIDEENYLLNKDMNIYCFTASVKYILYWINCCLSFAVQCRHNRVVLHDSN